MANNVAAGETEEERSIDLIAERNYLAERRFVHYRGKEVLSKVAAGDFENMMRIARADYHEEIALSMVAGDRTEEEDRIAAGSVAGTGDGCTDWYSFGEIGRFLVLVLVLGLESP